MCPRRRSKLRGSSIFKLCAQTIPRKRAAVTAIITNASRASRGAPLMIDCSTTSTLPVHGVVPKSVRQLVPVGPINWNSPVNRFSATPATMKSDTPEPKPHLLTTSSINIIASPPSISWIFKALQRIIAQPMQGNIIKNKERPHDDERPAQLNVEAYILLNRLAHLWQIGNNFLQSHQCFTKKDFLNVSR